ncbi:MAG: nickel-dependent hydrogenase large subunit [Pseudomonadota bacterium]
MKQMLTIDPVTRIEGHLKLQVELEAGRVTKAWSSSQLFRGIETIVQGRLPENVHHYVQRVCGVCTNTHALASVRAVEDAVGVEIPEAAKLVRYLILATQMMHDHVVHFYLLSGLDYMDMQSALTADVKAAARLSGEISGADAWPEEMAIFQEQLKRFVDSGQLGFLAKADFLGGNPAYKLSPEENLVMACNYLRAIRVQLKLARANAIFTSKNPHSQTMRVGGVTCYDALKPEALDKVRTLLRESAHFVHNHYRGDVYLLSKRYPDVANYGGVSNFYDVSEFAPVSPNSSGSAGGEPYFKGGILWGSAVEPSSQAKASIENVYSSEIKEDVARAWYEPSPPLAPADGVTNPDYTAYDLDKQYSWSKAPRYAGQPMETGPLARCMLAFARGESQTRRMVDDWLSRCDLKRQNLNSTMGRIAARMMETRRLMDQTPLWLEELADRAKSPSVAIYKEWKMPSGGEGVGTASVSRGALSHWITIKNGRTENYQMVVPSTWNLGPRCSQDKPSPVEQALVGVPVPDMDRPTDVMRTVHSLDPCIACAVHLLEV